MNKVIVFLFFFIIYSLLLPHHSYASHNRAGEITYRHVGNDVSLTYDIIITTYTKTSSCVLHDVCRPELDSVHFGDGDMATFQRDSFVYLPGDITKNVYSQRHTYSASGSYKIYFTDPNRDAG